MGSSLAPDVDQKVLPFFAVGQARFNGFVWMIKPLFRRLLQQLKDYPKSSLALIVGVYFAGYASVLNRKRLGHSENPKVRAFRWWWNVVPIMCHYKWASLRSNGNREQ